MNLVCTAESLGLGSSRNGHVRSSDGLVDLDLATAKEMGGADEVTNPEQLFAAGYAACSDAAVQAVARKANVTLGVYSAKVGSNQLAYGGFGLDTTVTVVRD